MKTGRGDKQSAKCAWSDSGKRYDAKADACCSANWKGIIKSEEGRKGVGESEKNAASRGNKLRRGSANERQDGLRGLKSVFTSWN